MYVIILFIYPLTLSKTCINLFLVLNTKEDILKNVENQTSCWSTLTLIEIKKITEDQQLFGYQHYSK